MTLPQLIRYKAFWLLDILKGKPVTKHYNDILSILNYYNSETTQKAIKHRLSEVLEHTCNTVPHYKKLSKITKLEDFPVVNKLIIKENYDAFQSEKFKDEKTKYKTSSSGSTGIPFVVNQDKQKRFRNIADTIAFAEIAGVAVGIKVIFMSVFTGTKKKNPLIAWLQNVDTEEVTELNEVEVEKFLLKLQKNKNKKAIWAYASALDTIAYTIDAKEITFDDANLKVIVACSEQLSDTTKERLQKHLKTPVISRYSNTENGILAQQENYGDHTFKLNHASYKFEILKFDEDTPQENGIPGRIVITDLFNYCMPLIRYDTGDVGTMVLNGDNVPVFTKIEGRKQDLIYNTSGELTSSFSVTKITRGLIHIKQYQFIQDDKTSYTFKVNAPYIEGDEALFKSRIKKILGDDANVTVEYIDEIPLLASGKRQRIVNNYHHK
jgi:phenylacetate-CoA ligase